MRKLIKNFNVSWYIYAIDNNKKFSEHRVVINSTSLYNERNRLLCKLYYTTIRDSPSLNVNVNVTTSLSAIAGLPSYAMKSLPNNLVNVMLMTDPPILFTTKSRGSRCFKTSCSNYGTISYIHDNRLYRYHGLIEFSNEIVIGPCVSNNPNIVAVPEGKSEPERYTNVKKENIEYKYVNKILFITAKLKVLVYIIPYLVNENMEKCYKYECTVLFYNNMDNLIKCLSTKDFFVYEECISEFAKCVTKRDFSNYFFNGYPAAIDSEGMAIPPVLNIDEFNAEQEVDLKTSRLNMLKKEITKIQDSYKNVK